MQCKGEGTYMQMINACGLKCIEVRQVVIAITLTPVQHKRHMKFLTSAPNCRPSRAPAQSSIFIKKNEKTGQTLQQNAECNLPNFVDGNSFQTVVDGNPGE